jgi:hypothetical protein
LRRIELHLLLPQFFVLLIMLEAQIKLLPSRSSKPAKGDLPHCAHGNSTNMGDSSSAVAQQDTATRMSSHIAFGNATMAYLRTVL